MFTGPYEDALKAEFDRVCVEPNEVDKILLLGLRLSGRRDPEVILQSTEAESEEREVPVKIWQRLALLSANIIRGGYKDGLVIDPGTINSTQYDKYIAAYVVIPLNGIEQNSMSYYLLFISGTGEGILPFKITIEQYLDKLIGIARQILIRGR